MLKQKYLLHVDTPAGSTDALILERSPLIFKELLVQHGICCDMKKEAPWKGYTCLINIFIISKADQSAFNSMLNQDFAYQFYD